MLYSTYNVNLILQRIALLIWTFTGTNLLLLYTIFSISYCYVSFCSCYFYLSLVFLSITVHVFLFLVLCNMHCPFGIAANSQRVFCNFNYHYVFVDVVFVPYITSVYFTFSLLKLIFCFQPFASQLLTQFG